MKHSISILQKLVLCGKRGPASTTPATAISKDVMDLSNPEFGRVWWYEAISVIGVCISCLSCGNFLGYTSSAVPSMQNDTETFQEFLPYHKSFIGGSGPLGSLVGALLSAIPLRYFGPRRTIAFTGLPILFLSWVIIGLASSFFQIVAGRVLGGIGVGVIITCVPLYVVDICSTNRRGKMGVLPQLLMISGILVAYVIGAVFGWKNLSLILMTFSALAMLSIFFAPDTPRWLMSQGDMESAFQVLVKVHGRLEAEKRTTAVRIRKSIIEIQELAGIPAPSSWRNLTTLKCSLVCLGVISLQQLTGVNGITFYAATILQKSSLFSSGGKVPSIILASTQILASLISTFLVERYGRRLLLIVSTSTVAVSTGALGTFYYFLEGTVSPSLSWVPLGSLILFAFGFAIGLGPITWIFCAEILPQPVRSVLNPVMIGYYWFCVSVVTTSFPWLTEVIHYFGVFWLYCGVSIIGLIFVVLFVPETKGKSLDEIMQLFTNSEKK